VIVLVVALIYMISLSERIDSIQSDADSIQSDVSSIQSDVSGINDGYCSKLASARNGMACHEGGAEKR
jgi:hypothetical protein